MLFRILDKSLRKNRKAMPHRDSSPPWNMASYLRLTPVSLETCAAVHQVRQEQNCLRDENAHRQGNSNRHVVRNGVFRRLLHRTAHDIRAGVKLSLIHIFAFIISMASGFPTTRLRPTMVTRFPVTSMSFAFKISMTASAVQGA